MRCYFICFVLSLSLVQLTRSLLATNSTTTVADLTSRFWQWRITTSPEYGTKYGFHDRDGKMEQLTPDAFSTSIREAREFLDAANSITVSHLSLNEKISLEVLKDTLLTYINGYKYRRYGAYSGITIFEHPIRNMKKIYGWMKFNTADDFKRAIQRCNAFAIRIKQIQTLMVLAFENNMTAPNVTRLESILEEYKNWPQDPEKSFLYTPFQNLTTLLANETLAKALQNEVLDVISDKITPAMRQFNVFLQTEYVKHLRSSPGVHALPNGKKYYEQCLRWHSSLDTTAESVRKLGLQEVDRICGLINKIKADDGFDGSLRAYLTHIKEDPQNVFETSEEILETFRNYVKELHSHLHKVLRNVPDYPIRVQAAQAKNSGNVYTEQSLDGSRSGVFTANVFNPTKSTRFTKLALILHEAEPGHHTQMSATIDGDVPNFRRAIEFRKYRATPFNWPFYTAYVEGWALYAESLGEDMNVYKGKYDLLGRYISEILRACRLVVDTGIHHYGWSFQQATEYLRNYTTLSEPQIQVEVTRYIYYPGQATAYKIGELTIKRLRVLAEQELGDRFDLRSFNSAVLGLGPVPLTVLEEYINGWIELEKLTVRAQPSTDSGATLRNSPAIIIFFGLVVLWRSFV